MKHMGTMGPHRPTVQQPRFSHCLRVPCTLAWLRSTRQTAVFRLNDRADKYGNSERAVLEKSKLWRCIIFIKDLWVGCSNEAGCRRSSYGDRNICSTLWWMGQELRRHVRHASKTKFPHWWWIIVSLWLVNMSTKNRLMHSWAVSG